MNVYLDYELNESGKGKFLRRLFAALEPMGVKRTKQSKADVALGISRWRSKVKIAKVLRIDGIRIEKDKKAKWYNEQICKSIKASNAIIYQSEFAKRYVCKKLKLSHGGAVIHNGVLASGACKPRSPNGRERVLVLVGNWGGKKLRKHKRLKEMLAFVTWFLRVNKPWRCFVAGKTPYAPEIEHVDYMGHLNPSGLATLIGLADVMLNLSDLDWCPNATVEALGAGLPVVGYSGTGAGELIEKADLLTLDPKATYEDIELAVIGARNKEIPSERFDIAHSAKAYLEVFKSVAAA